MQRKETKMSRKKIRPIIKCSLPSVMDYSGGSRTRGRRNGGFEIEEGGRQQAFVNPGLSSPSPINSGGCSVDCTAVPQGGQCGTTCTGIASRGGGGGMGGGGSSRGVQDSLPSGRRSCVSFSDTINQRMNYARPTLPSRASYPVAGSMSLPGLSCVRVKRHSRPFKGTDFRFRFSGSSIDDEEESESSSDFDDDGGTCGYCPGVADRGFGPSLGRLDSTPYTQPQRSVDSSAFGRSTRSRESFAFRRPSRPRGAFTESPMAVITISCTEDLGAFDDFDDDEGMVDGFDSCNVCRDVPTRRTRTTERRTPEGSGMRVVNSLVGSIISRLSTINAQSSMRRDSAVNTGTEADTSSAVNTDSAMDASSTVNTGSTADGGTAESEDLTDSMQHHHKGTCHGIRRHHHHHHEDPHHGNQQQHHGHHQQHQQPHHNPRHHTSREHHKDKHGSAIGEVQGDVQGEVQGEVQEETQEEVQSVQEEVQSVQEEVQSVQEEVHELQEEVQEEVQGDSKEDTISVVSAESTEMQEDSLEECAPDGVPHVMRE